MKSPNANPQIAQNSPSKLMPEAWRQLSAIALEHRRLAVDCEREALRLWLKSCVNAQLDELSVDRVQKNRRQKNS